MPTPMYECVRKMNSSMDVRREADVQVYNAGYDLINLFTDELSKLLTKDQYNGLTYKVVRNRFTVNWRIGENERPIIALNILTYDYSVSFTLEFARSHYKDSSYVLPMYAIKRFAVEIKNESARGVADKLIERVA